RGAQARANLYGATVRRLGSLPQSTATAAALLTEAALTSTDPYALALARLQPVWERTPGPDATAWAAGARRYHQAATAAVTRTLEETP
ncbi:MAG: hypothetical protein IT582_05155, partial [Opitutaceae bacterium]|nr:hypothetical protein [Opitutaceae bacterium]